MRAAGQQKSAGAHGRLIFPLGMVALLGWQEEQSPLVAKSPTRMQESNDTRSKRRPWTPESSEGSSAGAPQDDRGDVSGAASARSLSEDEETEESNRRSRSERFKERPGHCSTQLPVWHQVDVSRWGKEPTLFPEQPFHDGILTPFSPFDPFLGLPLQALAKFVGYDVFPTWRCGLLLHRSCHA